MGKALPALDTIVSVPHLLHQLPSLPSPTNSCYFVLTSQAPLSGLFGTIERIMPQIVTRRTGDEPTYNVFSVIEDYSDSVHYLVSNMTSNHISNVVCVVSMKVLASEMTEETMGT